MVCQGCHFVTERLLVKEWHSLTADDWEETSLARVVSSMLTEPVTRSLPTPWQGDYSVERAAGWIAERDREGASLLAIDRYSRAPVGLVILFETANEDISGGTEVRLGYMLAESAWGQGLASELVAGFVRWCREVPTIVAIAGGVEPDNVASCRVLEKNGFTVDEASGEANSADRLYRLKLRA